ncbi:hypothetical protein N8482_01010, partial [Chitinophagales bacterium]|nr:hypothetical protein [Chitinophagales bacterium]
IRLLPKLKAELGIRSTTFSSEVISYSSFEPRLYLQFDPTSKLSISATAVKMTQFLHLVPSSSLPLPSDLWFPSNENLLPEESYQVGAGIHFKLNPSWQFSVDAYSKRMSNQYIYPEELDFLRELDVAEDVSSYLLVGEGKTRAVETTIEYSNEKSRVHLSYALSKNQRRFEDLNQGNWFAHNYDQRHQIKLFYSLQLADNWQASLSWNYNSAAPRILIGTIERGMGLVNFPINPQGMKNALRSDPTHRLDVNVSYLLESGQFSHRFQIGLYNAAASNNVAYYEANFEPNEGFSARPVYGLPLLPSLSYSLQF